MTALKKFHYRATERIIKSLIALVPTQYRFAIKQKIKAELRKEIQNELKPELITELKAELKATLDVDFSLLEMSLSIAELCRAEHLNLQDRTNDAAVIDFQSKLRQIIRRAAMLPAAVPSPLNLDDQLKEVTLISLQAQLLAPAFKLLRGRRVLFCGQAYYNNWYLSRALRPLGWKADVYNWDPNPSSQIYYHGEDFRIGHDIADSAEGELEFYLNSLYNYDVMHFANAHGITYGYRLQALLGQTLGHGEEIRLLKRLGKKIVYSNNGCLDGVSQSAFSKWGPESACSICRWKNEPLVCSDERNLAWGKFRNEVSDYQCTLGGNRADFNDDPRVHEVPEFYCLNSEIWHPNLAIPEEHLLPTLASDAVRVYHAVGNRAERTHGDGINIKSSHIYFPLIDRLRADGLQIELIAPTGIANKEVRFMQVQSDIFLDMLTFGWFGANAREAMMLGKPVICFIRPEWLESVRREIPEYAAELPIISATPNTVEGVLRDLIASPEKRQEIGERSRNFALKWHADTAAGKRFDKIYQQLLAGDPLLSVAA